MTDKSLTTTTPRTQGRLTKDFTRKKCDRQCSDMKIYEVRRLDKTTLATKNGLVGDDAANLLVVSPGLR